MIPTIAKYYFWDKYNVGNVLLSIYFLNTLEASFSNISAPL